jgi:hypothetical protein
VASKKSSELRSRTFFVAGWPVNFRRSFDYIIGNAISTNIVYCGTFYVDGNLARPGLARSVTLLEKFSVPLKQKLYSLSRMQYIHNE